VSLLESLADRFAAVDPRLMAVAVVLQLTSFCLRSIAWRTILAAAYPGRVGTIDVAAAYGTGVDLNAFLPARGGDAAKVALLRSRVHGSSVPMIVATMGVLSAFDAALGLTLLCLAWATGILPELPAVPSLPGLGVLGAHPLAAVSVVILVAATGAFAARRLARRLRGVRARLALGLSVVRSPRRYLLRVVPPQVGAWACRFGAAYFLLAAFDLPVSLAAALLVVVVGGMANAAGARWARAAAARPRVRASRDGLDGKHRRLLGRYARDGDGAERRGGDCRPDARAPYDPADHGRAGGSRCAPARSRRIGVTHRSRFSSYRGVVTPWWLLLPVRCAGCDRIGMSFCECCARRLVRLVPPLCERCGAPGPWPVRRCAECAGRRLAFASARAAIAYDELGRRLIRTWKERGRRNLATVAAQLVAAVVPRPEAAVLAFVPGDRERQRARGHVPARGLAEELGRLWELQPATLLRRTRDIRPQRGLTLTDRRGNVRGAFAPTGRSPPRVCLVDDVYTTGATADACARELRRAGAREVHVVCLARALR
jgi:ComF family protein